MKCLVIGATGYIGSALVNRLVDEGYQVRGLIHHQKPTYTHENVCYVKGDISDKASIINMVKDIDVVFHCAGIVNEYSRKHEYYKVHVTGIKNLVEACKQSQCRKFIFLGHIPYEFNQIKHPYQKTKILAESYLLSEFKTHNFPVCIIRPGNVYGPNATTWVLRPLKAIQKNRISLINHGLGIFLHTYIDNLIDALLLTLHGSSCIGEIIDITDGDNTVTWGKYLNDLSMMIGKKTISRNISKPLALFIGRIMMGFHVLFGVVPMVSPYAVEIFSNTTCVSIEKASRVLGYAPRIDYSEGMKCIQRWVQDEGFHRV
jgi:nucleoside-diphosphate-sugar epimerase